MARDAAASEMSVARVLYVREHDKARFAALKSWLRFERGECLIQNLLTHRREELLGLGVDALSLAGISLELFNEAQDPEAPGLI